MRNVLILAVLFLFVGCSVCKKDNKDRFSENSDKKDLYSPKYFTVPTDCELGTLPIEDLLTKGKITQINATNHYGTITDSKGELYTFINHNSNIVNDIVYFFAYPINFINSLQNPPSTSLNFAFNVHKTNKNRILERTTSNNAVPPRKNGYIRGTKTDIPPTNINPIGTQPTSHPLFFYVLNDCGDLVLVNNYNTITCKSKTWDKFNMKDGKNVRGGLIEFNFDSKGDFEWKTNEECYK